jgi:dihydrofolate reductase
MRKLIVSEFLTLDGVMQAPGGPDEDRRGGFEYGGWILPFFEDSEGDYIRKGLSASGGLLLGRRTYEIFAAYWPVQPPGDPMAAIINSLPRYVVSRSLQEPLAWNGSTLVTGDIAEGIRHLKDQPGKDILVIGSGELVQALMRHDLVDEFRLMVHPLVLGTGMRLFREGSKKTSLTLIDVRKTSRGVLILTYRSIPDSSKKQEIRT